MLSVENYICQLIELLKQRFGPRLSYVGLQGSYLRGEATADSDIDIMVVIDSLTAADLDTYRTVIESLDHVEKSCGFLCGKEDLANWNPLELCHLCHTTKDCYGELSGLVPAWTREDVRNFVKLSVNNLYHELCHRYIHSTRERNVSAFPSTYKGVFYILQNLHYLNHGEFAATKKQLLSLLNGLDREVLQRSMDMSGGVAWDFSESFAILFTWCKKTLASL